MDELYIHDEAILFYFQALQRPWLLSIMKALTFVGEKPVLAVLALVLAGLLTWARRPRTAVCLLVSVVLAWGTSDGLKSFVHRPRPDMAWRPADVRVPSNSSFPSGHAFLSTAVIAGGAMLTARGLRRWAQVLLMLAGFGLSVGIGFSRVYLGVHYPLDVLSGWSGGLAYALLAVWADQRWGYQPTAPGVLDRAQEGIVSSNQGRSTS